MASIGRVAHFVNSLRYSSTSIKPTTTTAMSTSICLRQTVRKTIKPSLSAIPSVLCKAHSSRASQATADQRDVIPCSNWSRFGIKNTSSHFRHPVASLLSQQRQNSQFHRNFCSLQKPMQQIKTLKKHKSADDMEEQRFICTKSITKNLTLYTKTPLNNEINPKTLTLKEPRSKPLCLVMAWLMAKQRHLKKYAEIYTELGFDVLVVQVTPWQLLWPVKGAQIVAAETIRFLENNESYAPIVVHGFSVGAYQIGEIMLQMSRDMERYAKVLNRFGCQIWDSAADISEIHEGVPKAIFPNNPRMRSALRNYTIYHLKTFRNQATVHYMRSSQMFHSTILKAPALIFVSENDPIGPPSSNNAVRENWERSNISVTYKCWAESAHASHYMMHRDEYLALLLKHLENAGVLGESELQKRAKL